MANKRKSSSRKSRSKKGATLLQLQKLAKANNIKVTGLKKSTVKAKLRSHGIAIPRRKSVKSSAKKCKSGQTLNKSTGRCRKSPSKKSRSGKKCKSGQTLNRSTKRCRTKCKPGQKRNSRGICK